jgi:superoxide dismutase
MKIILLLLIFTFSAFADDSKLCNQIVKLASSKVVSDLNSLSNLYDKVFQSSCSKPMSLQDQLVQSIVDEDKEKFNAILDKLEDSYIFKLLNKISNKEDETKKFRKYLNDKFKTLSSRITKNEKASLQEDPLKTLFVFYQYNEALEHIKLKDPELYANINKPYGKADSIRHMFINAVASRFGLNSFVKSLSTQRELSAGYIEYNEKTWRNFIEEDYNKFHDHKFSDLVSCNPKLDKDLLKDYSHERMLDRMIVNKMDIHNNAIGIEIGSENPCSSLSSIYKKVKAKYKSGTAREIISSAGRCFDVSSNYDSLVATNDNRDCIQLNSEEIRVKSVSLKNGKISCL